VLLQEAFRHCKAIAAWGDGATVLKAARIPPRDRAFRWPTTSATPSPQTWRRRSGCTVHGTEPRRSWPRRFPCPLTHGDKPLRAAGVTVSRLSGSPSPHDLDGGPQPLRHFPRCGYPVYD
jgi:C-terminal domain found in long catalases